MEFDVDAMLAQLKNKSIQKGTCLKKVMDLS